MGPSVKFTKNLILRVENEDKALNVLDLYVRNPEFEKYEPTRPNAFYTEEYHEKMLRREYQAYMLGTFLRYYIYKKDNLNTIIGSINFNIFSQGHSYYAELGYKIDSGYQNQGLAYEACLAGIEVMARDYGISRIDARILPDNLPSIALAKKLGFAFSVLESKSANVLGRYVDVLRYTLDTSQTQ